MIEKISKICWNDFGWTRPSGTNGKSPSSGTHEKSQGYGFEEWLFDKSKIIDGFHYSFLQPLRLKTNRHVGKTYKLWLYTVTAKQKFLVGYIDRAICISKEESIEICKRYKQNGWIKEMAMDLETAGIGAKNLKDPLEEMFFNVKFKVKDITIYDDFPVISSSDINLKTPRYKLLNKVSDFKFEMQKQKGIDSFLRKSGSDIFVDPFHNKIQNTLSKLLKHSKQYSNIKVEENNVDVKATSNDGTIHFFEIKTDTPKNNIRLGIGQLFEYSMFPNTLKAEKLIVVGDSEPTAEVKKYIRHLREKTGLNLFYRWIDMENEILSNEI